MEIIDLNKSGVNNVVKTKPIWSGLKKMGGEVVETVNIYSLKELYYKEKQRNRAVERNMGSRKVSLLKSQHACMLMKMSLQRREFTFNKRERKRKP